MKTFVKILVAILVVAALCGGIYLVLPETAQTFVKGNIQYRINDEAKKRVDEAKSEGYVAENGFVATDPTHFGKTYHDKQSRYTCCP